MHISSILECKTTTGTIEITVSGEREKNSETFSLSPGEWKRLTEKTPLHLFSEVNEEIYDALTLAAERTAAVRMAARFLSSGDKSAKELTRKLIMKGISGESAAYAIEFLKKRGYLKEADACARLAEHALRAKHYGPRRIKSDLMAHGYSDADATAAIRTLSEEDFREALHYNIQKKFPDIASYSPGEKQKAIASLTRLGFGVGDIIDAIRSL